MRGGRNDSVDMILCDLPYGTTACKWDTIIPFEPLWTQYKRLIKDNGAIVLTASQPFTSALVMSNIKMFKQSLVWEKTRPTNVLNARKMFMKWHEDVLIFYNNLPTFNPQMTNGKPYTKVQHKQNRTDCHSGFTGEKEGYFYDNGGKFYPKSVLKFATEMHSSVHPTQKPVALFEYLIRTYTNEGATVLDNCAGSGTTGVACLNTGRKFILIEKDPAYCEIIRKRIAEVQPRLL
jgi:site-specific DNA-methyltransferase (adenine-specific)